MVNLNRIQKIQIIKIYFFTAFLSAEDSNVVGVDWSGPGGGPLYNVCRNNAKPTGDYLALLYAYLVSEGTMYNLLHCVGHSLGAHVCGYSGKAVNGTLGRASGLDPALPLFDYDIPEERLADTDALYVDVIHTCGGYLGFERAIGHADYFPNNGSRTQPGCGLDVSGNYT
jgi:pancreatic triacylglycerol lipase